MDATKLGDVELEKRFQEHNWRKPIPVPWLNQRTGKREPYFCCPFCAYRFGLIGPRGAALSATQAWVWAHLGAAHPDRYVPPPPLWPEPLPHPSA